MFTHSVNCPYCNGEVTADWSEYVVGSECVAENCGMGAEVEHVIECEAYECPYCAKSFRVVGSVWEYPEGAYNDHELNSFKK